MSRVLAIMIMLIAIAALVLIALMLDYGISTKTLRLLLIALLPKIERIYAPPTCPYYNGYWFTNNYDIAMILRTGNNSIIVDKKSIIYISMDYSSKYVYTFIVNKPKGVLIFTLFPGIPSPIIMPNASGTIKIVISNSTLYLTINSGKTIKLVPYPPYNLSSNYVNMRIDSLACVASRSVYGNYIYVYVIFMIQPAGWRPTLNIYLMSNCTFYGLSNCNYRSETVYIYFRKSDG
ncbi:hypothetical protein [Vulcanisaeta sp. JCM 16159]|uniref:hypothetical protein n=1 Tax=Vulcanisaeta sp. JCM 16159 TaxID=1295371 RepID=UPI0006D25C54|nr:hypothetical protein [Vulcanisaeta sp. JCM 16159]